MRLAFFGTGTFAVPTLRRLAPHVVLAATQPDRPSGRGHKLQQSPVKEAASELGLAVATPERARAPEFVDYIRSLNLDALVVASYGQILSQALLDCATRGGINLHGSVLPKYRGAAPIQRALLDGEKRMGVTLMQMDKGMDTGDIIEIDQIEIGEDETYGEVQDRLAEVASNMAEIWLPRIVEGHYARVPQDSTEATIAAKVEKAEAGLSFERSASQEYNRFRAFTPAPGAFLRTANGVLRIGSARLDSYQGTPGTVISVDEACTIAFSQGSLRLLEVQPEGKKRMSGRDYANGLRLKVGSSLI